MKKVLILRIFDSIENTYLKYHYLFAYKECDKDFL